MPILNACPFLKGALGGSKESESDCILEKCFMWNMRHRECWIVTSLKGFGSNASSFSIPPSSDKGGAPDESRDQLVPDGTTPDASDPGLPGHSRKRTPQRRTMFLANRSGVRAPLASRSTREYL